MKPTTFLGGKVLKFSLPVVMAPPGPEAPRLKRLRLPQGELAQFYDGEEGIRYLATLELRPGTVRGNHYHKVKSEWLYLISGEVLLVVEEPEPPAQSGTSPGNVGAGVDGTRRQGCRRSQAEIKLETGDVAFIPTGIAHAFRVVQPGVALEFSSARFDPGDIYRHGLL